MVRLNLGSALPSTSWKYSQSSSGPHSQNHPSWMSLHIGRRPGTCPWHTKMILWVNQPAVEHLCGLWMNKLSPYPVLTIHILVCIPFPGEKRPLPADDLSGEERGQSRVFLREWTQQRNSDVLFASVQPNLVQAALSFSSLCKVKECHAQFVSSMFSFQNKLQGRKWLLKYIYRCILSVFSIAVAILWDFYDTVSYDRQLCTAWIHILTLTSTLIDFI